jgi:hypothetical protein
VIVYEPAIGDKYLAASGPLTVIVTCKHMHERAHGSQYKQDDPVQVGIFLGEKNVGRKYEGAADDKQEF